MVFKDIGKIFFGVIKDEMVFFDAFQVKRGGICTRVMIEIDVTIYNARGDPQEKKQDHQFITYPGSRNELYTRQQPAKKNEIREKEQIIQDGFFECGKLVKIFALHISNNTG